MFTMRWYCTAFRHVTQVGVVSIILPPATSHVANKFHNSPCWLRCLSVLSARLLVLTRLCAPHNPWFPGIELRWQTYIAFQRPNYVQNFTLRILVCVQRYLTRDWPHRWKIILWIAIKQKPLFLAPLQIQMSLLMLL